MTPSTQPRTEEPPTVAMSAFGPEGPQPWPPAPARPPARRSGAGLWLAGAVALVVGLLAGAVGAGLVVLAQEGAPRARPAVPAPLGTDPAGPLRGVADVADEVLPSVVQIQVRGNGVAASGSGFVIDRAGHVLTNNHVVDSAAGSGEVDIVRRGGRTVEAQVVGRSPSYDLAVLDIDDDDLDPVRFGRSRTVRVGETVVAVGSPLGLRGTVTAGIVSARNRPVTAGGSDETSFINALQTDAAINPGNSGGPLVNLRGQVIGVNSAIATLGSSQGAEGSIGVGFAIPIDQARRTAQQIIATGHAAYPVIGATVDLQYDGLGARLLEVTDGSPAAEAGLEDGDVVVAVDGRPVANSEELIVSIRSHVPGDVIELAYQRDGKPQQVKVKLGSKIG